MKKTDLSSLLQRVKWLVLYFARVLYMLSLLGLTVLLVDCGEEAPEGLSPEATKPLLSSAPLLSAENHSYGGWGERADCLECHKPSTIMGHGKLVRKCADCHGRNGVGGAVDTCETCHGQPPDTGNHISHVKEQEPSCEKCHFDNFHANGVPDLNFPGGGKFSEGTCTTKCHKSVKWGESGCSPCHGNPPDTGNHSFHVKEQRLSCEECHSDNIHVNDVLDLNFLGDGDFNEGTCTTKCHKSVRWGESGCSFCHENPPDTGEHKLHVEEKRLDCDSCHRDREHDRDTESGEIDVGGVEYKLLDGGCASTCHEKKKWGCKSCHGYPPDTGKHKDMRDFGCNTCHKDHNHSYKAAMKPSDFSNVEVKLEIMGSYEEATKTCKNVGCHEDRRW